MAASCLRPQKLITREILLQVRSRTAWANHWEEPYTDKVTVWKELKKEVDRHEAEVLQREADVMKKVEDLQEGGCRQGATGQDGVCS